MNLSRLLLGSLAALTLASAATAQTQELFTLSRFNNIWRIDGYDTAAPTPTLITSWSPPPGGSSLPSGPLGLEVDPATGDFFVLIGAWNAMPGDNARLIRVDPSTGSSTLMWELPFENLTGLERRWDGKLLSIEGVSTLVIIDPQDGSIQTQPLAAELTGIETHFVPFELDTRGYLQVLSDTSVELDPATGAATPSTFPGHENRFLSGFVMTNSGELYAGNVFPSVLYRYDASLGGWDLIYSDGGQTMNNIYDMALTNPNDGQGFAQVCEGAPNSSGVKASLELLGVSDAASNDLRLVARDLPGATVGMYLMGDTAGSVSVGSGELCIAPTVYRYGASFSSVQDTYAFTADLTALPNGLPATAGTTQIFQFWFRDSVGGTATSNLSDAISVSFQ